MGLNCLVIFFDCNEAKMFEVGLFAKSLTTYSRFAIIFVQFVRIFSNSLKITSRIHFILTLHMSVCAVISLFVPAKKHSQRPILLSKFKKFTNTAGTIKGRVQITNLRYLNHHH